jgi:hypothetical protein
MFLGKSAKQTPSVVFLKPLILFRQKLLLREVAVFYWQIAVEQQLAIGLSYTFIYISSRIAVFNVTVIIMIFVHTYLLRKSSKHLFSEEQEKRILDAIFASS